MVTRMNACLLYTWMRVTLHSDSFFCVVRINILEDLFLTQRTACLWVSCEPQPWSLGIEVISDAQIILSCFYNLYRSIFGLLWLRRWLGEHIIISIAKVIKIKYFIVLLSCTSVDYLWLLFHLVIIDVQDLLIIFVRFFFRILGLHPTIIEIDFQIICIIFMELFELFDPLFTRNSFCNQILLIFW